MLTKYNVHHLRNDILRALSASWPATLAQWDMREFSTTGRDGTYTPVESLPHPMLADLTNCPHNADYLSQ